MAPNEPDAKLACATVCYMTGQLPVRKAILERRTYEAPAEGREGKVRLDFNENTAGCSPAVIHALRQISAQQFAMYPEYEKGADRLARYFGVCSEELLLTNGGDDALRVFFDTFVDPGSSILICEPTFPMYRYYAEIFGASVEALRYGPEMEFPTSGVLAALKRKPRVLFIANPNNPTGTLLEVSAVEKILQAARKTVVVIDEAYAEFSGVTLVSKIGKYPHLFIARTFSKAAGLAGLRLGAVIARAESLSYLRRAMPPFPVNVAALVAAQAAVNDRATIRRHVREIQRRRQWFAKEMHDLGVKTFPSAGNFLLANFGPDGPQLFQRLEREGISLRERSKDIGRGFARITVGTQMEMNLLLKKIKQLGLNANRRR
ncbi:MAG TPA: histidinol-phosphate transaminase [Candidatus Saccharimonadales bacterium]|nr:histidinol-phosphate transaminase [Candidatus Saccharimonadales bacterium]